MRPIFHSWYLGMTHALRYTVSPTFKFVHHSIAASGVVTFCSMHVYHNQPDDLCSKNLAFFSCGLMRGSDCGGPSQTFAKLPFSMAPEDVDTEIETDNTVRDMYTFLNTMHDLKRQLQEKDQTLREQNEMLTKKDQTVREQNQTIQKLLARQGRFDVSQLEEASPVDQKLSLSFSPYQTLREKDKTLQEQGQELQEKDQVLQEEDQAIEKHHARHATFKCRGCVVQ